MRLGKDGKILNDTALPVTVHNHQVPVNHTKMVLQGY